MVYNVILKNKFLQYHPLINSQCPTTLINFILLYQNTVLKKGDTGCVSETDKKYKVNSKIFIFYYLLLSLQDQKWDLHTKFKR